MRFPKDLALSFVGLASKDNLKPLLIGGLATGAAVVPEQNVENYFGNRGERLESVGEPGEILGNARVVGGSLAAAFLVSRTVGRPRERPNGMNKRAFPSGHTSTSFTWATVLQRNYGWKIGAPAYLLAGYVGATRLEERAHHLTDIVAGASIGYIVGRTVTRSHHKGPQRITWTVAPMRGGATAGLAIQLGRVR